jgi:hypothetical protein
VADRRVGETIVRRYRMQIERIGTQADAIGRQHPAPDVAGGQPLFAYHVARLAHVHGIGEAADAGIRKTGKPLA